MIVDSARFGPIEADPARVMTFARGLLGFPKYQRYVLVQVEGNATFYWLQSIEQADLAFVVADPFVFEPTYRVPGNGGDGEDQDVLVIVNKCGTMLTANLQGPLVIDRVTRQGEQVVLGGSKYGVRHPILQLGVRANAEKFTGYRNGPAVSMDTRFNVSLPNGASNTGAPRT